MAVVIGAGTVITGTDFSSACVVSVNWACNPNVQRLYCLGSTIPQYQFARPIQTLSIVIYSQTNGPTYSTEASITCDVDSYLSAGVSPAHCDVDVPGVTAYSDWVLVNYGYSKDDPNMPGQETWGLQRWPSGSESDCEIGAGLTVTVPEHIIRGIAEGQAATETENSTPGVVFDGVLSYSDTGNVSAGAVGRYDRLTYGTVSQVGGSGNESGKTGQGSVSVPYTPVWF